MTTLTRKVLRDGWLCTGDLARCDADGQYFIVDRKDDLIITSGYNVYPSEVEAVLSQHPAVQDVAVVGREDRLRGQVVIAHVVLRPWARATTESLLAVSRQPARLQSTAQCGVYRPGTAQSGRQDAAQRPADGC
jgi:acyl-CoA synthetase (AMP-forming)/AMP-acid ligase II